MYNVPYNRVCICMYMYCTCVLHLLRDHKSSSSSLSLISGAAALATTKSKLHSSASFFSSRSFAFFAASSDCSVVPSNFMTDSNLSQPRNCAPYNLPNDLWPVFLENLPPSNKWVATVYIRLPFVFACTTKQYT